MVPIGHDDRDRRRRGQDSAGHVAAPRAEHSKGGHRTQPACYDPRLQETEVSHNIGYRPLLWPPLCHSVQCSNVLDSLHTSQQRARTVQKRHRAWSQACERQEWKAKPWCAGHATPAARSAIGDCCRRARQLSRPAPTVDGNNEAARKTLATCDRCRPPTANRESASAGLGQLARLSVAPYISPASRRRIASASWNRAKRRS